MSAGKWLSFGVGVASALLIGGMSWYASTPGVFGIGIAAVAGGLTIGLLHLVVVARFESELHRLIAHIEAMSHAEHKDHGYKPRSGLGPIAMAVEHALTGLRGRIDQLVTTRRELEVQVRIAEAERRHAEAILNSINDGVVVTDAFNEIALCNASAARSLGFELETALRKPVDRVVSDPTLVKLIKDTREAGQASLRRHVEHRLGHNGTSAIYDVTLACVASDQPTETSGVVTILHDITREKEIAEMKSDFVSNVSHELRTPLSSIKAYMEMLVDGEAHDEQTRSEFYNIIQGETNRLSRLIDNILNISRIESGVVKVQREHVSLPGVIKDVLDVMQPQARAKNIELSEIPTPVFFQVFADKDMIYQAVLNLVSNAIKYTLPSGKVTVAIGVDEHDREVSVSVADSGVGVPPDDLPHLFEKFYRVADHKKLAKGTGLGLNLVKHIIETVHGGRISVSSVVGKGSTFTFGLPMADDGYERAVVGEAWCSYWPP